MQCCRLDLTVPYLHVGATTGALQKHTGVEKERKDSCQDSLKKKLKEHFWCVKILEAFISCCWRPKAFRETGLYRHSSFSLSENKTSLSM